MLQKPQPTVEFAQKVLDAIKENPTDELIDRLASFLEKYRTSEALFTAQKDLFGVVTSRAVLNVQLVAARQTLVDIYSNPNFKPTGRSVTFSINNSFSKEQVAKIVNPRLGIEAGLNKLKSVSFARGYMQEVSLINGERMETNFERNSPRDSFTKKLEAAIRSCP